MAGPRKSGKKEKKSVPRGIAHINSTFNNTHVAFTDAEQKILKTQGNPLLSLLNLQLKTQQKKLLISV